MEFFDFPTGNRKGVPATGDTRFLMKLATNSPQVLAARAYVIPRDRPPGIWDKSSGCQHIASVQVKDNREILDASNEGGTDVAT